MTEVEYYLNLKSYYGFTAGGSQQLSTAQTINNQQLTYYSEIQKLFNKICSAHNCNRAIMQIESFVSYADVYNKDASIQYDIVIDIPSSLTTVVSSCNTNTATYITGMGHIPGQIIGTFIPTFSEDNTTSWYYSDFVLTGKTKLYLQNINTITQLTVNIQNGLIGLYPSQITGDGADLYYPHAYSMTLKITPILS